MLKNQPYISHTTPLQWVMIIVGFIAISNLIHWGVNRYNHSALLQTESALASEVSQLKSENALLLQQNQQLSTQVTSQTQMLAVNEATSDQLSTALEKLQKDNMALTKQLQFYQNITQGNTSSKLQVREVQLRPTDSPNTFYYRLVITQGKKISKPMSGQVIVSVINNKQQNRQVNEHKLNLRYVQVIEGQLTLTEQEIPSELSMTIKQGKKKLTSSHFPWEVMPNK